MLTKHFLKRLFTFIIIIAVGACITLVANYAASRQGADTPARAAD